MRPHDETMEYIRRAQAGDKAALDAYQSDPYHVSVVKKFMHAEAESSVAVDFEIEDGTIVKKP